jgi:hypothetical protein
MVLRMMVTTTINLDQTTAAAAAAANAIRHSRMRKLLSFFLLLFGNYL